MINRLRVLRAEREWSQADLASHLGVSRQTVNAIETGKYDPSLPLAFQMAKLFGLRIEEIFRPNESSLPVVEILETQERGIK
jgi:putative transcriptional regulator